MPKLLDEYKFEEIAEELAIGAETLEAVKMFDECVRLMHKQDEDANDFVRNMVKNNEGFADRSERTMPLKNFWIIIPAVTTCYIDHVIKGRDKINKRNNTNAFISDDGFALGVCFLLKILSVTEEFQSLNWFESQERKLNADIQKAKSKQALAKGDVRDIYTEDNEEEIELSVKRTETIKKEYRLLDYSLNAASILFKDI